MKLCRTQYLYFLQIYCTLLYIYRACTKLQVSLRAKSTVRNMNADIFDACEQDDISTMKICISQGVDIDAIHVEDEWTPLQLAAMYESINVIRFLIAEGVNINKRDDDMMNALHYTCDTLQDVILMIEWPCMQDRKQSSFSC